MTSPTFGAEAPEGWAGAVQLLEKTTRRLIRNGQLIVGDILFRPDEYIGTPNDARQPHAA